MGFKKNLNECLRKSIKGVSRMYQALRVVQGRLRNVPKYLHGWFKGPSKLSKISLSLCFKGVLRKDLLRKFQRCSKKVSRVFQEYFNGILYCDFVDAWISSQLPEQKKGLFYSPPPSFCRGLKLLLHVFNTPSLLICKVTSFSWYLALYQSASCSVNTIFFF